MASPLDKSIDWPHAIRAIWAARLAPMAARDGGDPLLPGAWSLAVAESARAGWELRAVVPLLNDPEQHRWAAVLGRPDAYPPPNLVFIHGLTAASALAKTVAELEAGITMASAT